MKRLTATLGFVVMTSVIAIGCGGGTQEPAGDTAPATSAPAAPAQSGTQAVDITLTTDPDPARMGENTFEVMVMDQNGRPVIDANVSIEFYMAAMPAMNMPEMRNRVDLAHDSGGRYRGTGNVMMAGNWDVTVMAMRGGQEIGSRKMTLAAK